MSKEISEKLNETNRDSYHPGFDYVARELGYKDLKDLANQKGYDSPQKMAEERGFKDVAEFFNAPNAYHRIRSLRKI